MKATILFTSFLVIIGSIVYISKPTNAIGSGVNPPKPVTTGSFSTSMTIECPVVGKKPFDLEPNYEYTVSDGEKIYDHCHACNIGAYLPSKETNTIRCTFCGIEKGSHKE